MGRQSFKLVCMKIFLFQVAALMIYITPVQANVVSTGMQNFNPTPDGLDFLTVQSSETLSPGIINIGLFFNNAYNSLPYYEGSSQSRTNFNDSLLGMDINIGAGITENFELGFSNPMVIAQTVSSDQVHTEVNAIGATEARFMGKYRFHGDDSGGWAGVYSASINRLLNNPYIGKDGGTIHTFELAWDTTIKENALGINVGYRKTSPGEPYAGVPIEPIGDQYIASAAVSRLIPKYDSKLIAEIFGSRPAERKASNPDRTSSSLEMIVGIKHEYSANLALHAGWGAELLNGVSSPDWRIYTGLNYTFGPVFSKKFLSILSTSEPQRFRLANLNFEFDSEMVSESSEKVLAELAEKIRSMGSYKEVIIEGHTDSVGRDEYNKTLSQKRADFVRNYLLKHGFSPDKIKAVGYGSSRPIADNGNFQGRSLNRRVEFEVVK